MTNTPRAAVLTDRAVVDVIGPDARTLLQGLLTQDVETLRTGEMRYAALLTPQGRLLHDLFVLGREDGVRLDGQAALRADLVRRLRLYRLRAKVEILESDAPVLAVWGAEAQPADGWAPDPRLGGLGWRAVGAASPAGCDLAGTEDYRAHCLAQGVPGPADFGHDRAYPIEADFDLLGGIDFHKGCFVGQETTSRMKRRGTIKNRMTPIRFEGPPPEFGSMVTAGGLRAGEALSGFEGRAMALLRLDRLAEGDLRLADGRPFAVEWPHWLQAAAPAA